MAEAAGTQGVSAASLAVSVFGTIGNGAGEFGLNLIILENDVRGSGQSFQVAAERSGALKAQTGI